jgi:hypothetical protein
MEREGGAMRLDLHASLADCSRSLPMRVNVIPLSYARVSEFLHQGCGGHVMDMVCFDLFVSLSDCPAAVQAPRWRHGRDVGHRRLRLRGRVNCHAWFVT